MVAFLVKRFISKRKMLTIGAILFWLLVWQVGALVIDEKLFLPSPILVISRLGSLVLTSEFWYSIGFSLIRVASGFMLSLILALVLAILAYNYKAIEILIEPLVKTVRAIPVASIVILVLVWVSSRNLSIVISFMIIFPVIYTNVLEGLKSTSNDCLELADIYHINGFRRIRYIYLPYSMPFFFSAMKSALGLGWKSAIAAEVIGLPNGSIGSQLYDAKVFFSTPDLFAWTIVIVLLASIFEHLILFLLKRIFERCSR